MMNRVTIGRNHCWARAREGMPDKQVIIWEDHDGTTSSASIRDPEVAEWLAAGGEPKEAEPLDPGPPRADIDDLIKRVADLEAKKSA